MSAPVAERLLRRSVRSGECLLWTGSVIYSGYGRISVAGRPTAVHRVAYELWVGPIPAGLEIDHLCKNRNCIEPSHLEAVTHHENLLRSSGPVPQAMATGHCLRGHPLPEPRGNNGRSCPQCKFRRLACPHCEAKITAKHLRRHIRNLHPAPLAAHTDPTEGDAGDE